MLGLLWASGQPFDIASRYSLPQIILMAECIGMAETARFETIGDMAVAMFGGKTDKKKQMPKDRRREKRKKIEARGIDFTDEDEVKRAVARDMHNFMQFKNLGITVE